MDDGPFTDDMIRHALSTVQTQHGIIKYAEAMAQVLAEAGRASHKATGDSPAAAVLKWAGIIQKRALEILRDDKFPGASMTARELQKLKKYDSD